MGQTSRERETDKEAKTGIKTRAEGERDRRGYKTGLYSLQVSVSLSLSALLFGAYKWVDWDFALQM